MHFKDSILDDIAQKGNVAQFVSFSPDGIQRYSRVVGYSPNHVFRTVDDAVSALLRNSTDGSVNVRSFDPTSPKSKEFVYGLQSVEQALSVITRLGATGLYTIVNETINVHDGGVSGVSLGGVIEFSPEDTPRCVERPGTVAMSRKATHKLLKLVYGFEPDLPDSQNLRVEFSIHPVRRGVRGGHTILWEVEEFNALSAHVDLRWPNNFSRFIGDKAFGLLIAQLAGLPVPHTTVFARKIAPFSFGRRTGTHEPWIRTCPIVQMPGKFTTRRGWIDPFILMRTEDPSGAEIASVLCQDGIDATYSGAALTSGENRLLIEGTEGYGDEFMVGRKLRAVLPEKVEGLVRRLYVKAAAKFGPVRMEWVVDRDRAWIVQFHKGASVSFGNVVVPGDVTRYSRFDVSLGLEELRSLVDQVVGTDVGIELVGEVGITSHFGDILRRANVPSVIVASVR
jgi:hypothetical protein